MMQLSLVLGVFIFFAKIFLDIEYFNKSSMIIFFWFLSVWNLAQISFALLMSSFISKSSTATLVGYTVSIFLILFISMMSQFMFASPGNLPWLIYMIPQGSFVRFFYLGISKCVNGECISSLKVIFGDNELLNVFVMMHVNAIGYFFLGLIFNEPTLIQKLGLQFIIDYFTKEKIDGNVAKQINNSRASSGTGMVNMRSEIENEFRDKLITKMDDSMDESSFDEGNHEEVDKHVSSINYQELVKNCKSDDPNLVLLVKGLTKAYPCSKGIKRALTNFSIKIEKGKIFGLLGPNGAGKTTFLSCVTGSVQQDRGVAWICGNNTKNRNDHAGNIGFCPQFDILWPQLNVYEHLKFLAFFKGEDSKGLDQKVTELIKQVDLEKDYKKLASRLSGGMKRRCSLAMSLTGNPKIVFLDEPSSGLDPVKRRHFWSLVKKVTEQRAVLLTTHLMEEADTLCSEIGILTSGKMRCVGNSIYLKKTFTHGIKIQIVLDHEVCSTEQFMKRIQNKLNGVTLLSSFQGTLILTVKDENSKRFVNQSS